MENLFKIAFIVIPVLLGLSGLGMVLFPRLFWEMSRFAQRLKGLATAEEPSPGVLMFGRIMGVLFMGAAVGFYFFSQYILTQIFPN